jgi:hypothetical protein
MSVIHSGSTPGDEEPPESTIQIKEAPTMGNQIATEDIVEKNAQGQTVVLVHAGQRIPAGFEYPAAAAAPAPAAPADLGDFSLEALGDEFISRFAASVEEATDGEKEAVADFYANLGKELDEKGVVQRASEVTAPNYDDAKKDELEQLIEARAAALVPEGTGNNGDIVKADLVKALQAADAVTLAQD